MNSDPREVLADFMLQGHLEYRTMNKGSDYDTADAMIRDLAAEGLSVVESAELTRLRAANKALVEAAEQARDILAERVQGSPARSPAHSARLRLERALSRAVEAANE